MKLLSRLPLSYCGHSLLRRERRQASLLVLSANYFLAALGRFAPYLERLWLRFATPCASRVPRMMW